MCRRDAKKLELYNPKNDICLHAYALVKQYNRIFLFFFNQQTGWSTHGTLVYIMNVMLYRPGQNENGNIAI